jgi:hypothetical protein
MHTMLYPIFAYHTDAGGFATTPLVSSRLRRRYLWPGQRFPDIVTAQAAPPDVVSALDGNFNLK